MEIITLTKVQDPTASRWLTAISADYDVPKDAAVFEVPPTVITALRNEIARRSTPTHVFALDEITDYGAGATHTAWVHSILR